MDKPSVPTVISLQSLDFDKYAEFQKDCFRQLLKKYGADESYMTAEFYRWKYFTPLGEAKLAVAYEGDELICANAFWPSLMATANGNQITWQSADSAVNANMRRGGLGYKALMALCLSVDEDTIDFGLPNIGMIGVGLKAKFEIMAHIPVYAGHKWLRTFAPGKHTVKEVFDFSEDFNTDLSKQRLAMNEVYTVKNVGILNWRYLQHPINKYRIFESRDESGSFEGYAVTREVNVAGRDALIVMELRSVSLKVKAALLNHIRARMACSFLIMICSSVSMGEALLLGLCRVPEAISPKKQILVVRAETAQAKEIRAKKWIIDTGDWDGF